MKTSFSNFALFALVIGLFLTFSQTTRAQSALDGFDPNANGGVRVVRVQSDGKILIGGNFTTVSPNGGAAVTRNRIARFNPDGTLDTAFNPNANSIVSTIVVQSDGKILAGGFFNVIGGQTRNNIARLDGVTGLADAFDPNANNPVVSIAVQSDGKILAGGDFTTIGGQPRNRIARLDATTGLADSFDPNANEPVVSIAVQSDGKILAGGDFTTIGGQPRIGIARLDGVTGLADAFNPSANNGVRSIAVQADGKILAGGFFNAIGGQPRTFIARLDATTGLADSFDPNVNGNNSVFSIAVQADGKILAGGFFTTVAPNGGAAVTRNNIVRFEKDGRLDQTLNLSAAPIAITSTAVQPDGKIIIGGIFSSILGVGRNHIARLNTDGTLDTAFNPNANNDVYSIAVQADGKILVGGFFTNIGGQTRNRIARLDGVTGLADSFNPNATSGVYSIAVQTDGKILVGGVFTSIGGQTRNSIARLDGATGLADSFNPNPNATSQVFSITVQADAKILVGGSFTSIGGQPRNNIARLDGVTGLADSFDPNAGDVVYSIAVQADGKILVGGNFNAIGGQPRNRIARLSNDTAALSTLTVTRTTITLTRNGSAAQFSRVTFEQSVDNGATYTFLGTATNSFAAPAVERGEGGTNLAPSAPQSAGYTLTGQNLPTGQNILIRARGFYRTGYTNGSESIEEKVQNAFLASVSISGRVIVPSDLGLTGALVTLTDSRGISRTIRTGKFGSFIFRDVAVGETYIITVYSRRYTYAPQIVTPTENITGITFTAQ